MPTYDEYISAARNADQAGDAQAAKRLLELANQARVGTSDVATDVIKSIPAGARQGVETGIGGFGDVQQMNRQAVEGIAETVGAPDWLKKGAGYVAGNFPIPGAMTTQRAQQSTNAMLGPNYQSQTVPGKVMREATEWAVGAAPGGLPGMGRRVLSGAAGGVASEMAGQAAEGTGLENEARIASGLLASGGVGALEGVARSATPDKFARLNKRTPSIDDMRSGATQTYENLRQAGIAFDPNSSMRMLNNAQMKLTSQKFKPRVTPQTHGMVRDMSREIQSGNFDFGDLVAYRQRFKDIARDAQGPEKGAAAAMVKEIDNYRASLTPADLVNQGIDPQMANAALKKADDAYRRSSIAQDLQDMMTRAEMTAGTNYTMAGVHTALKREIKNYANKSKFLKPEERKAMQEFAKSGDYAETLKQLSRFKSTVTSGAGTVAPTGLAAALSGADPTVTGLAAAGGAAGLYGIGAAASSAAEREARRRIQSLELMIRSGRIPPEQRADMVRRIMSETVGAGARGAYTGTMNEGQ